MKIEFGILKYDESKYARIFLGLFSFKIILFYKEDGFEYTITFDKQAVGIVRNDITRFYPWKKILRRRL